MLHRTKERGRTRLTYAVDEVSEVEVAVVVSAAVEELEWFVKRR